MSYRHWQLAARTLLDPLAALMQPGRAALDLHGPASDHDRQADRLESFARPLLLASFYLQSVPANASIPPEANDAVTVGSTDGKLTPSAANEGGFRDRIAHWFRAGLVIGTDPASAQYWGPDASYHQHHVEMGLMAIALQIGERDLWTPLTVTERDQIARWFGTSRGSGIVNNNHLFMSVHILEFLGKYGYAGRTDRAVVETHLNQLETMHRGGGWFEDGINQAFDHYNAYAFHFYGLMWTHLQGQRDAQRAQRWREWSRLFVRDYSHFFAASGEHPAFGRSICYRFNGINVFGLALAEQCTELAPGMLRRLCTRSLDFFLRRPIYQEQGCLSIGFTDRFDRIAEPYSCAASPYWAAKGFTPLLLPPTHAFWNEPEVPLPSENPLGFVRLIRAAGLVVRGTAMGEVELLNGGSMIGNTQLRYGAWKWSKLSYRTGAHFTFAFPEISNVSLDSALTQQLDDGRLFARHSTVVVEMDEQHLGYTYNLGSKIGQVNTHVETFAFWHAGWLLHVHHVKPQQPVVLRVGGFALPLSSVDAKALTVLPTSVADRPASMAFFAPDHRGTALQPLLGFSSQEWDTRLDETSERRHVAAPYHVTPVVKTDRVNSPAILAALAWTGRERNESGAWNVADGTAGTWKLSHPKHGTWEISHWSLPALS